MLFVYIFVFVSYSALVTAQDNHLPFAPLTYDEALATAHTEKKPILLYFHFDGCGACGKMEKEAFANPEVIEYYKEHFILKEVNTRKGEGIIINKKYNVRMHPTFIYIDHEESMGHQFTGLEEAIPFIQHGKDALCNIQALATYKIEYADGRRDAEFLYQYCYQLDIANDVRKTIVNEYLATQSQEQLTQEKNLKFIYDFAVYNLQPMIERGSIPYRFLSENKGLFASIYNKRQVDLRILLILMQSMDEAVEKKDENLLDSLILEIESYDDGHAYMYNSRKGKINKVIYSGNLRDIYKLKLYSHTGNQRKYLQAEKEYISKIWDNSDALNRYTTDLIDNTNDLKTLKEGVAKIKRSIALRSHYYNNETYAILLSKINRPTEAKGQAQIAMKIGRQENRNVSALYPLLK